MDSWFGFGNAGPFWPDLSQPVELRYEFDTRINVSRNGREQRIANRPTPRVVTSYSSWLPQGRLLGSHEKARNPADPMVLPVGIRFVRTADPIIPGQTTFEVAGSVPFWVRSGARIVFRTKETHEAKTITGVAGSVVTVDSGIIGAYPAGMRVHMAALAYRLSPVSFAAPVRGFETVVGEYSFAVDERVMPTGTALWSPSWEGVDIFEFQPNARQFYTRSESPRLEIVDGTGRGLFQVYAPDAAHGFTRTQTHQFKTKEEMAELVKFFARQQGRKKRFYAPAYLPKARVAGTIPNQLGPGPRQFNVVSDPTVYLQAHPHDEDHYLYRMTPPDSAHFYETRIPLGPGSRSLPVTFQQALFPSNQVFQIIHPEGPGEAHVNAGLVQVNVRGRVRLWYPSSNVAAAGRIEYRIRSDARAANANTTGDASRWSGIERQPGSFLIGNGIQGFYEQENGDPLPGILEVNETFTLLPNTFFVQLRLNWINLASFGWEAEVLDYSATVTWGAVPEPYFETYNPILTGRNDKVHEVDSYRLFRFDSDRLVVRQQTDEVSSAVVNLRALPAILEG